MAGPPRPANAASLLPVDARNIFRSNSYHHGTTLGFCRGYLQAGIAAIPADLADDFAELCRRNRGPLPLLYRSRSSGLDAPPLAEDSDIRSVRTCKKAESVTIICYIFGCACI